MTETNQSDREKICANCKNDLSELCKGIWSCSEVKEALASERRRVLSDPRIEKIAYLLSVKTGVNTSPLDSTKETFTHLMKADVDQIKEALSDFQEILKEAGK